jgi:hypothetical protein
MKLKWATCLLLAFSLTTSLVLTAQQNRRRSGGKLTFTSPDGSFRFAYSDSLVSCRRNPNQSDRWVPDESCEAYTPVCSDFSCDSAGTVACIAYPIGTMKGSNFQAAAFSVNEIKEVKNEAECESLKEPPPQVGKPHSEIVKGVKFAVTETDGVAAGNLIDGFAYRNFHRNKCYELDIRIAFSNLANYDPGTMKNFRLKPVQGQLKKVLDTFEFTK